MKIKGKISFMVIEFQYKFKTTCMNPFETYHEVFSHNFNMTNSNASSFLLLFWCGANPPFHRLSIMFYFCQTLSQMIG